MRIRESIAVGLIGALAVMSLTGCDGGGSSKKAVQDPPIHSMGDARIMGTFSFDFDNGSGGTTAVPAGDVEDVFWRRMTATDSALEPENGARVRAMGVLAFDSVSWDDVVRSSPAANSITNTSLPAGTVVAFQTDAGRFGKLLVKLYSGNQDMDISWVTWE